MRALQKIWLIICALMLPLIWIGSAHAQIEKKPIELPESGDWLEDNSQMTLPENIGDLQRVEGTEYGEAKDNFAFLYKGEGNILSIYIYQTPLQNPAIWFHRAQRSLWGMDIWADVDRSQEPVIFAPPGHAQASAAKIIFALDEEATGFKATGLALMQYNEWVIKLRYSSNVLEKDALGVALDEVIQTLHYPALKMATPVFAMPPYCEKDIATYDEVKQITAESKDDAMQNMLSKVFSMTLMESVSRYEDEGSEGDADKKLIFPQYCKLREDEKQGEQMIFDAYRPVDLEDGYFVVMSDAGYIARVARVPDVFGALMGEGKKKAKKSDPVYSVYSIGFGLSSYYMDVDKLPSPGLTVQIVNTGEPQMSTRLGGSDDEDSTPEDAQ